MSTRELRLYFGGLALLIVLSLAFAFRPTPLSGFGADDLAQSVSGGGPFEPVGDCRQAEDGWKCEVYDSDLSGTVVYDVEDPDLWGCWTAERAAGERAPGLPATMNGCITLLSHM